MSMYTCIYKICICMYEYIRASESEGRREGGKEGGREGRKEEGREKRREGRKESLPSYSSHRSDAVT